MGRAARVRCLGGARHRSGTTRRNRQQGSRTGSPQYICGISSVKERGRKQASLSCRSHSGCVLLQATRGSATPSRSVSSIRLIGRHDNPVPDGRWRRVAEQLDQRGRAAPVGMNPVTTRLFDAAPSRLRACRHSGPLVAEQEASDENPSCPGARAAGPRVRRLPAGAADPPHGERARQPRPTNGIFVAMIVMNSTLASSGRLAM